MNGLRVRWRIFGLLFALGLLAYAQRTNVTIAADRMMPALHLSQLQIGWIEQAFVIGYALFQLPGGLIGQRLGARSALTLFGLAAFIAVIMVPAAPELVGGTVLFVVLVAAQLLLGAAQGGLFPVSSGVFETWFPVRQWSLVQGAQSMGLNLGSAITPPLIAALMLSAGWQRALVWSSIPAVLIVALWAWYARDTPREHRAVSTVELTELGEHVHATVDGRVSIRRLLRMLGHRNTALLTVSYLLMNYSFYLIANWCFLYLIQQRHFPVLESGWLSVAPPIAGSLGAGIGGLVTGWLCPRIGLVWGFRAVPLLSLPLAGVLLLIAMQTANPFIAVAALAGSFGCIELNEAAYWAASMAIGRSDAMAIGGVLNTGGNLGGIIGIPVVAWLSGRHAWGTAFAIGSLCAVVAALLWLRIDVDQVVGGEAPAGALASARNPA
ncbi:MAG TPA: MFS transporter [Steroidobacteraceae bacterium]|nr:MFS transporter [Steroidobacteraceae bacterium]